MQISAAMVKELRERTGAGMMDCKKALVEADGDLDRAVENMRKSGQAKADKKAGRIAAEGVVAVAVSDDGRSAAMVEINCETDFVAKEDEFREFAQDVAGLVLESRPGDADALAGSTMPGGSTVEERRRELIVKIGENMSVRRFSVIDAPDVLGSYLHGGRIGVVVALENGNEAVARDLAMHIAASRPLAISETDMPAGALDKEREILQAQVAESGKPPEIQEKMLSGRLQKYLKEVTLLGQPFVKDPDQSVAKFVESAGASVVGFERFEVGEGIEKKTENFAEEVLAQARGS